VIGCARLTGEILMPDASAARARLDGGPGMPLAEFERTVTLSFQRW